MPSDPTTVPPHAQPADAAAPSLPVERYDEEGDEHFEWMNPRPVPLDAAIARVVRHFAASGAEERGRMRAVDYDAMDGLRGFARRAALFALRERSAPHLRDGLAAIAMLDDAAADPRDAAYTLAMLHHAAVRIGEDPARLFGEAAALAKGEIRNLLAGFPSRPPEARDLLAVCALREARLPDGPVFLESGRDPYDPTRDLVPLIMDLARVLAADQYRPVSPWLALTLAHPMLQGADSPRMRRALKDARAGATLLSHLRPGLVPGVPQSLSLFVVEAADQADACTLLDASRAPHPHPEVVLLGLEEGRYFLLLRGGSHAAGVRSYETPERLPRFAAPMTDILRRHAALP